MAFALIKKSAKELDIRMEIAMVAMVTAFKNL
jgi:hypothetical protein